MSWLIDILRESWNLYYLAAPFILFGVFMAGVLQVLLSSHRVVEWMGRPGMAAVGRAALLGVPLPLCSCGVFPVSIALRRKGATAPSTMSFLVTTPETSADAIVLTWALLGPVMAVVRPIAAFFTGGLAGALAIAFPPPEPANPPAEVDPCCGPGTVRREPTGRGGADVGMRDGAGVADHGGPADHGGHDHSADVDGSDFVGLRRFGWSLLRAVRLGGTDDPRPIPLGEIFARIGRQAFIRSMDDIVFWLTIGLVLAGAIAVLVPPDLVARGLGSGLVPMLLIVLIAIPMYTCASSSTPVAAALIAKGLSPGAALVFLLAGPAASTASMLLIHRHFGAAFLRLYLAAVVIGSVLSGLALDFLLARTGWTVIPRLSSTTEGFVAFVQLVFVVFLSGLILWRLWAGGFRAGVSELRENLDAVAEILSAARGEEGRRNRFRLSGRAAAGGFRIVPPDSTGYAKVFGRIVSSDLPPGLRWAPPSPFGTIDVWRVHYPRKSDVGFTTSFDLIARRKELRRQAPPNEWHSPVTAMNADSRVTTYLTGDENLVELSFTVHYFLSDPTAFFYGSSKDADWVGLYGESVARELVGRRTLDLLLTEERSPLEQEIATELQARLDRIGLGVRVNGVHLVDLHPPQGAVTAFRDVSSAREDRQTRIHQAHEVQARDVPLARGAGLLDVARERADAEAAIAEARGRAAGYRARSSAYRSAPGVLGDLLWLETAEEVLPGRPKLIVPPGTETGSITLWKMEPPLPPSGAEVGGTP